MEEIWVVVVRRRKMRKPMDGGNTRFCRTENCRSIWRIMSIFWTITELIGLSEKLSSVYSVGIMNRSTCGRMFFRSSWFQSTILRWSSLFLLIFSRNMIWFLGFYFFCFFCRHLLGFLLFLALTIANSVHFSQLADFITMFTKWVCWEIWFLFQLFEWIFPKIGKKYVFIFSFLDICEWFYWVLQVILHL